ncbi:MAG: hypothetical protein V4677_18095 [Bacteroidota bacterium]
MKKITLLLIITIGAGFASCKKDRVCECTNTYTDSNGDVTTNPEADITIREVNKREGKDLCQKTTRTYVNPNGGTSTDVYDCKLK